VRRRRGFPCSYAKTSSYASNNGNTTLLQQDALNLTRPTVYADPQGAAEYLYDEQPGSELNRQDIGPAQKKTEAGRPK
jgi:hypothetical protein